MSQRPLVLIYQEFEAVTVSVDLPDLNCLLVGPCYALWDYATDKADIQVTDYGDLDCEAFGLRPAGPQVGETAYEGDLPQRVSTDRGAPDSIDIVFDELYAELAHGTGGLVAADGTAFSVPASNPPKRQEGSDPNADTDFITADVALGDTVVLFPAYTGTEIEADQLDGSTELDFGPGDMDPVSGLTPSATADELTLTGVPGDFDTYAADALVTVAGSGVADHNGLARVKTAATSVIVVYKDGGGTFTTGGTPGTTASVTPVRNMITASAGDPFDDVASGGGYVEIAGVGAGYDGVYPILRKYTDLVATLEGADFPAEVTLPFKVFTNAAIALDAGAKTATFLAQTAEADGPVTEVPISGYALNSRSVDLAVDNAADPDNIGKYFIVDDGLENPGVFEIVAVEAGGGTNQAYKLNTGGGFAVNAAAVAFKICDTPVILPDDSVFVDEMVGSYLSPVEEFTDTTAGNKITEVSLDGFSCTLTNAPTTDDISGFIVRARVQTKVAGTIGVRSYNLLNILTGTYAVSLGTGVSMPYHVMHKLDDVSLPAADWTYDDPQDNYVTIDGGRQTLFDNFSRVIVNAEIYIEHHDLKKDATTLSVQTIESPTDITTKLGEIHPDNPLALLTAAALSNTNTSLQALGVNGDDLEDTPDLGVAYLLARDTISSRKDIYAIVPATIDTSVLAMWKAHVEAMADPELSRFRVVIGAWELPAYRPISTTPLVSGSYQGGSTYQEATAPTEIQVFKDDSVDDTTSLRYQAYGGTNDSPTIWESGVCENDVGGNSTMSLEHSALDTGAGAGAAGDLVLVTQAADPADVGLYVIDSMPATDKAALHKINGVEPAWGVGSSVCNFALFKKGQTREAGNEISVLNGSNASLMGGAEFLACFDLPLGATADDEKWFIIDGQFRGTPASADDGLYRIKAGGGLDLDAKMSATDILGGAVTGASITSSVITLPSKFAVLEGAEGWVITLSGYTGGEATNNGDWVIDSVTDSSGDALVTATTQKDDPAPTALVDGLTGDADTVIYGLATELSGLKYFELEKFNTSTRAWDAVTLDTNVAEWGDMLNTVLHETAVEYDSVGTPVWGEQDNQYQNRLDTNEQPAPGDFLFVVQDGSGSASSLVGTYEILKVNSPKEFEIVLVSGAGFPEAIADKNVAYYIMRDTDGDGTADTFIGLGTTSAPIYGNLVTAETPDERFVELRNADASFVSDGVAAGDRLEIVVPLGTTDVIISDWDDDDDFVTLYVESVINENRLLVDTSISRDLNELPSKYSQAAGGHFQVGRVNVRYRVRRALSKSEQVDYLEAYSAGFDSKRLVLVWPDAVELGALASGTHEGFYLAGVVGGMVAGLPSQQGFTNLGIAAVDRLYNSAPDYFSDDEITEISNAGWMVFQQDTTESLPYCVHQLTTHQSGVFDFEEFSVVKNFDFVALAYKAKLDALLGKYNLVADTVGLIRAGLNGVTTNLKAQSLPFLGAPITAASISSLGRLAGTQDRVEANMSVTYPRPMNRIGLHLVATTS